MSDFWKTVVHVKVNVSPSFPYTVLYSVCWIGIFPWLLLSIVLTTRSYWWVGVIGLFIAPVIARIGSVALKYSNEIKVYGSPQNSHGRRTR
jgi:hypothetical protein